MAIVGYVDFTTIGIVIILQIVLDQWAFSINDDEGWIPYNICAGLLGVFTLGWVFNDGYVTLGYNPATSSFVTVDPNVMATTLAVMTIASFLPIYIRNR